MNPAQNSKRRGDQTKLLALIKDNKIKHTSVGHLVDFFNPGDLLIVNQSATLPSSFRGRIERTQEPIEIRLAAFQGPSPKNLERWLAFSFGSGDWRRPTEDRGKAPNLIPGDRVIFGPDLFLEILKCDHSRLLDICFVSPSLARSLYKYGEPIQYSYLSEKLEVWDQQTIFSGPPISVEPPSALFPLTWDLVFRLKKKGVKVEGLLHGAGISSTGSKALDTKLPLREWYEIPQRTVDKFNSAKKGKNRIISFGTSALRALESAWDGESLSPGSGLTSLKIKPGSQIQSVDGLITGMHEVGTSHMNILDSFCQMSQIQQGYREASRKGYLNHEYGDIAYLSCG